MNQSVQATLVMFSHRSEGDKTNCLCLNNRVFSRFVNLNTVGSDGDTHLVENILGAS